MDKVISNKEQQQNKRKSLWRTIGSIVIIALVFLGFRYVLRPQVKKNDFIAAVVEAGDIQNTLSATGLVIPAYEIELNAPVNSAIKNVMLSTGQEVKKNDLIMELDNQYVALEYEQLYDEWEVKKNNISKLKLAFDKKLRDLDFDNEIKKLELEGLEAALKNFQRLLKIGGATAEDVEKAVLKVSIAKLQNKKLANELDFRKRSNKSDKRNLELALNIQSKKLKVFKTKLDKTAVKSPEAGVITWINEDLGRKINEGELIARIANLDKFKIQASCADRYSDIIKTGMPVNIRINKQVLKGSINAVLPTVENNTLKFTVKLENEGNAQLRPNMKVEVFVVTDEKKDVLKIKKGVAFKGASQQQVFVVRNGKAIKKHVILGISSANFIEIRGDISLGDRVIISDTKDFEHLESFMIK